MGNSILIFLCCIIPFQVTYSLEDTCSIAKSKSQIEQKILQNGFHRKLITTISITTEFNLEASYILVGINGPSGAYVDPNELQSLQELGGPQFYIPQFVNVELPEKLSPNLEVYFFEKPVFQPNSLKWIVNISIPLHIRYHSPKSGSVGSLEAVLKFPLPSLYISFVYGFEDACQQIAHLQPCVLNHEHLCDWLLLPSSSTGRQLEVVIPVGDMDMLDTVLFTTAAVSFGATVFIIHNLFLKKSFLGTT